MNRLHQIQFRYDPHEDRALLRLATTAHHEFRFWVTRRYARLLWTGLSGSAARDAAVTPPEMREAVLAIDQEAAVAQADFKTRFDDATTSMPLGEAPVLLARLKCARHKDGTVALAMHPVAGQGIEIRLDQTLLHSMLKLLAQAAQAAEWNLNTAITQAIPSGRMN